MNPPRFAVNCSLLFQEFPVLERPAAAAAAGFGAIEFWWPWEQAEVTDAEVDAFASAVRKAGVELVGLNFFAGDLPGPDCGVASIPARSDAFVASVEPAIRLGEQLGTRRFNALFGNRVEGVEPTEQDTLGVAALAEAARAAATIDAIVMVEPVSGPKPYPLRTADDAMAIVRRVRETGAANVGLLADFFHLSNNGDDVPAAIERYARDFAHVQIADVPGRHQPGTGELPLGRWIEQTLGAGYDGWFGLEYVPEGPSAESFAWLPEAERTVVAR